MTLLEQSYQLSESCYRVYDDGRKIPEYNYVYAVIIDPVTELKTTYVIFRAQNVTTAILGEKHSIQISARQQNGSIRKIFKLYNNSTDFDAAILRIQKKQKKITKALLKELADREKIKKL